MTILSILGGIGGFLKRVPWQAWLALAIAFAIWRGVSWHADKVERMLTHADRTGYVRAMGEVKEAQARATAAALAAKAKAEKKQAAITEEAQSDHAQAVGTIRDRATALRVRTGEARLHPDRAGQADLPRVPGAPGQPDEGPGRNRLLGNAGEAGLTLSEQITALEQAELNTAQLLALQKWIRDQEAAFPKGDGE